MSNPLWKRLRDYDWEGAGVAAVRAKEVQKLMQDLASHKEVRSMRASQRLWSLLRADENLKTVAKPFLEDVRRIATPSVTQEIDELLGM